MTPSMRSAVGILLIAACVAIAVLCAAHGILFGTFIALIAAGLFSWAVYDNRKLLQERQRHAAQELLEGPPDQG